MACLAFAGLACSAVHADQLQEIRAKKTLVCGTFAAIEPFGFSDPQTRQTVGYDVDLCKAVAREMGVAMEHRGLTVEARIPELNLGRVDILIANLAYTKTRASQIEFSDAYHVLHEVVIVTKESGISTLDQLSGKKVSATKGSTSEQAIRMRIPSATPVAFQDASAAYLALQQGKVDGFSINDVTAAKFVRQSASGGRPVVMVAEPTILEPMGIGVKKGEPALLAEVNSALTRLEKSGELARNWEKWLGPKTEYGLTRTKVVTPIKDLKFDALP
ncbi:MAG: ABC transporter [Burkholderiales bacterium GWA2_64_37]|nr:MAG: ABC transporter [Burkholderiales bacterium GWA2_64_37]